SYLFSFFFFFFLGEEGIRGCLLFWGVGGVFKPGALRRPMTWGDPRGLSGASYTIRVRFNRW
ncbi:hypothetical protein, partial [Streptomyces europaeiscabiei]|uniref:hypothetical protein n=1 Tax=Streptomyces europaeiscabiei TaxID=146819 RepID=UPI0029A53AF0